jgi:hypothetical protein
LFPTIRVLNDQVKPLPVNGIMSKSNANLINKCAVQMNPVQHSRDTFVTLSQYAQLGSAIAALHIIPKQFLSFFLALDGQYQARFVALTARISRFV